MDIEPWHVHDVKHPLNYVVNRVKVFTNDIATQSATPFLHRYLYRDHTPSCILSCFAAAVVYSNRTPANAAMVMRALDNNVRELHETEDARKGITVTPLERLARTQALFLYQTIRLLDGDVMLRSSGERDIPLLKAWLNDLGGVRDNLGGTGSIQVGEGLTRAPPPRDWEVSSAVLQP